MRPSVPPSAFAAAIILFFLAPSSLLAQVTPIALKTNDLIYDSDSQRIYATTTSAYLPSETDVNWRIGHSQ